MRIPGPNSLFLFYKFSFVLTAEFISLPIKSEISFMWKGFSSSSTFFSPFFFSTGTGFYGSPFAFHASSTIALVIFPSTKGIFALTLPKYSKMLECTVASAMVSSASLRIYYYVILAPISHSLTKLSILTPPFF